MNKQLDKKHDKTSIYMLKGEDSLGRKILPVAGFNKKQVGLF